MQARGNQALLDLQQLLLELEHSGFPLSGG
jgi:hypothetical protein